MDCVVAVPAPRVMSAGAVWALLQRSMPGSIRPRGYSHPRGSLSESIPLIRRLPRLVHLGVAQRSFAAAATEATTPLDAMPEQDKFLFDLNGYVVVKNVFSADEVAAANAAIDAHVEEQLERRSGLRNTRDNTAMSGDGSTGRLDLGRCLEWDPPHSDVFRKLLAHPRMVPYFHELLGKGYRMDHLPLVLAQNYGAEGFQLHGGVTAPVTGKFQPHLEYSFRHGTMHNMLLGCTLQLVDHDPGDGGFCICKGSHKANYPMSEAMVHGLENSEHIYQPVTTAGDVLLFSEAATHGSLPWTRKDKQRRVALFRFSPANVAYGRNYMAESRTSWPAAMYERLTTEQAAVLQAPFAGRLDRVELSIDEQGQVTTSTFERAAEKKEFDKAVLGDKTLGL